MKQNFRKVYLEIMWLEALPHSIVQIIIRNSIRDSFSLEIFLTETLT